MLFIEKGMDIIVFGVGYRGKQFIKKYENFFYIRYCVDNRIREKEQELICEKYKCFNPCVLKEEKICNCIIIITIDEWIQLVPWLNNAKLKIFEHYIPWNYIEYKSIDLSFLRLMDYCVEEKTSVIRKMAKDKKICVIYGFCHLQAYKQLFMRNEEFNKKYIFIDLPAINNVDSEAYYLFNEEAIYNACDVFLFGKASRSIRKGCDMFSLENIKERTRSDCKIISITGAAFKGYFPQHTVNYNLGMDENEIPISRYFAWGDKNINRMVSKGISKDIILKTILDDNFYDMERCKKYFENEFKLLEREEERCDVKIADYLRSIYNKTITHYSWTHPISIVLLEIARRIALLIGIEDDFRRFEDENFLKMDSNEEIIYPSVLRALGLNDEEHRKRKIRPGHMLFDGEKLSLEEYILKYIEYISKEVK